MGKYVKGSNRGSLRLLWLIYGQKQRDCWEELSISDKYCKSEPLRTTEPQPLATNDTIDGSDVCVRVAPLQLSQERMSLFAL